MKIKLKPTKKQFDAYEALKTKDEVFFGGGAGGGKSWWLCESRLVNCYLYPEYKSFIGREELKRLMQSTYVTWQKVCSFHKIPSNDWKLNGQYNYIEFKNGSRIDLIDLKLNPSDPLYERYGSLEYTDGAIEEAGEVNALSKDVLGSRIGRHKNKEYNIRPTLSITGNPKKNWTYKEYYKPHRDGTLPEQLSQIKDKSTKQRLMFGNWEYDDSDTSLVKYDDILDMFTNPVKESNDKYLIADIARYGGDKIVKGKWKGLHCYNINWKEKQGLDTTTAEIKTELVNDNIPRSKCMVDEDGVGGGVKDNISGIKGFVNNSTPLEVQGEKQNYQNLKTQCAYELARNIKLHTIKISVEDEQVKEWIIEELELLRSKDADKDGKLKIIPKEEMKELIGRSPDFLDMLIMRMWYELKPHITTNQFTATKKQFV